MLAGRRRIWSTLRRGISSDDDFLFANDRIESKHKPKAETPFRVALRAITRISFYGAACLFVYTYYTHKKEKDPSSQPLIFSPFLNSVRYVDSRVMGLHSLLVDPPLNKLLPDMPKPPPGYGMPKTLVLDLRGTIVSTEYVFGKGFEIMKRPGLNEFLHKMSQMYEVIVFSDEEINFTSQICSSLDPRQNMIFGRLGSESLCYRKGELVKDLSYLNRDLRNVIIIDKNPTHVRNQPDNAILVSEFKGDSSDRELKDLIPFLEYIAKKRVSDVRTEIDKYGHTETGRNFLKDLEKLRSTIVEKNKKGLFGILRKDKQEPVAPLEEGTPKPPI